jgi:hypothetical protein
VIVSKSAGFRGALIPGRDGWASENRHPADGIAAGLTTSGDGAYDIRHVVRHRVSSRG